MPNGAHCNQIGEFRTIPNGWAVIPDSINTDNFPFGEIKVKKINGIMTVTSWIPSKIPDEPKPTSIEQRKKAYNTERIISWGGFIITVTEAATLWQYYAAEGSDKASELTALIAKAKKEIRTKYPDIK